MDTTVKPGWYWFKGAHVTGALRFVEWSVLQVKKGDEVLASGTDIAYRAKDFKGHWIGIGPHPKG